MPFQRAKLTVVLLAVAVFGSSLACSRAHALSDDETKERTRQKVADAAKAIQDYTAERKDEVVRKVKEALEDLDSAIDSLEGRLDENWDKMDQTAREKGRAALRALRRERNRVGEWYGGLKHGSTAAWDQMKQGLSEAYGSLQRAWEKAEEDLRSKN